MRSYMMRPSDGPFFLPLVGFALEDVSSRTGRQLVDAPREDDVEVRGRRGRTGEEGRGGQIEGHIYLVPRLVLARVGAGPVV